MRKAIAALAAVALGAGAIPAAAGADGFVSDVESIQVVSASVGGKNVFVPSTIVVVAGKPVTLSVFNTTDVPHGFAIPGLKIQEVLPVQQEHLIKLPGLKGGNVYGINCHLHPPHRTATLVVLPAAD